MNKKQNPLTENVIVRTTQAMKDDLTKKAQQNRMNPAEYVRFLLAKDLYNTK